MAQSKAQLDNLKKGNKKTEFKSGRKAAEAGRKGGIASGEAKRRKKTIYQLAKTVADSPISNKNARAQLNQSGSVMRI